MENFIFCAVNGIPCKIKHKIKLKKLHRNNAFSQQSYLNNQVRQVEFTIKINKSLPTPIHSVYKVRFQARN